jgi:hypothetical protein
LISAGLYQQELSALHKEMTAVEDMAAYRKEVIAKGQEGAYCESISTILKGG